jgi:ketosteroid isomerase-like protein
MKFVSIVGALLFGLSVTLRALADATPDAALDALHKAGADANAAAFEALLSEDVVFLGVGGAGRLEGQAARAYFSELMAQGNAWVYSSSLRETRVSDDGSVAWFDETLEHGQLGLGRATGVLVRSGEGWKVAQYNLTVPVSSGATPAAVGVSSPAGAASDAVNTSGAPPAQVEDKKRCLMNRHKTNAPAKC